MRAYLTAGADGRLIFKRTQGECAGKPEALDMGTSHADRIAFLNMMLERERTDAASRQPRAPAPMAGTTSQRADMNAEAVLSRIDGGADIDLICERILQGKGYALRRMAGCVAVRFQQLADGQ